MIKRGIFLALLVSELTVAIPNVSAQFLLPFNDFLTLMVENGFFTFLFFFGLFFAASAASLSRVFPQQKQYATLIALFLSLIMTVSGIYTGYLNLESLGPWALVFFIIILLLAIMFYFIMGKEKAPSYKIILMLVFAGGVFVLIWYPNLPYWEYIFWITMLVGLIGLLAYANNLGAGVHAPSFGGGAGGLGGAGQGRGAGGGIPRGWWPHWMSPWDWNWWWRNPRQRVPREMQERQGRGQEIPPEIRRQIERGEISPEEAEKVIEKEQGKAGKTEQGYPVAELKDLEVFIVNPKKNERIYVGVPYLFSVGVSGGEAHHKIRAGIIGQGVGITIFEKTMIGEGRTTEKAVIPPGAIVAEGNYLFVVEAYDNGKYRTNPKKAAQNVRVVPQSALSGQRAEQKELEAESRALSGQERKALAAETEGMEKLKRLKAELAGTGISLGNSARNLASDAGKLLAEAISQTGKGELGKNEPDLRRAIPELLKIGGNLRAVSINKNSEGALLDYITEISNLAEIVESRLDVIIRNYRIPLDKRRFAAIRVSIATGIERMLSILRELGPLTNLNLREISMKRLTEITRGRG